MTLQAPGSLPPSRRKAVSGSWAHKSLTRRTSGFDVSVVIGCDSFSRIFTYRRVWALKERKGVRSWSASLAVDVLADGETLIALSSPSLSLKPATLRWIF